MRAPFGKTPTCAICGWAHGTQFHPATEYSSGDAGEEDFEEVTKPECPNALRGEPAPLPPPPYDRRLDTDPKGPR